MFTGPLMSLLHSRFARSATSRARVRSSFAVRNMSAPTTASGKSTAWAAVAGKKPAGSEKAASPKKPAEKSPVVEAAAAPLSADALQMLADALIAAAVVQPEAVVTMTPNDVLVSLLMAMRGEVVTVWVCPWCSSHVFSSLSRATSTRFIIQFQVLAIVFVRRIDIVRMLCTYFLRLPLISRSNTTAPCGKACSLRRLPSRTRRPIRSSSRWRNAAAPRACAI